MTSDWVKPGTKIACVNELQVPNPLIPNRPFIVRVGHEVIITRIGPGKVQGEDGHLCLVDANIGDVVVGWFDFGTGTRSGYISQRRGDFEYFWVSTAVESAKRRPQRQMTQDVHPDQPGKQTGLRYVGYWASSADPEADRYLQQHGLELPWPEDFVCSDWGDDVRAVVLEHLRGGEPVEYWRGNSTCRFGCDIDNGSRDLSDGTYVWPEGFAHYVEAHNVKPPQEFIRHVYAIRGHE